MGQIDLICAEPDTLECGALQAAMRDRAPKAEIRVLTGSNKAASAKALQVQLQVLHRATDFMVAQLVWTPAGGTAITGPKVEISTNDRTLTSQAPKRLAHGLLKVTDLPI